MLTATDGTYAVSRQVNWNVAPRIALAAIADQSNTEGDAVSLPASATSPDGATLTYRLTGAPPGVTADPNTGLVSGNISSGAADRGTFLVTLTATDGTYAAWRSFNWTVAPSPLRIANPGDQNNTEGDTVSLPVAVTDTTGSTPAVTVSGLPAGLNFDATNNVITGTLLAGAAGYGPFAPTVTATDGTASVSRTFNWNVSPPGRIVSGSVVNPAVSPGQDLTDMQVGAFTDSNAADDASAFTAQVRWSDGSTSAGKVVSAGSQGQFQVLASHAATLPALLPAAVTILAADLAVRLAPPPPAPPAPPAPAFKPLALDTISFQGGLEIPTYRPAAPGVAITTGHQWKNGAATSSYLYARGDTPALKVTFKIPPGFSSGYYTIRGVVRDGPGNDARQIGTIRELLNVDAKAKDSLVDTTVNVIDPQTKKPYQFTKVDVLDKLTIQWQMAPVLLAFGLDLPTEALQGMGTSQNPLYVGFAKPGGSGWDNNLLRHQMVDLACRAAVEAAKGQDGSKPTAQTDPNLLLAAIWGVFVKGVSEKPLKNSQGQTLGYYNKWSTPPAPIQSGDTKKAVPTDLAGGLLLVSQSDGQCSHWSEFFLLVLAAQGLASGKQLTGGDPRVAVLFPKDADEQKPAGLLGGGFLIGAWTFGDKPQKEQMGYDWTNTYNPADRFAPTGYKWGPNAGVSYDPSKLLGQGKSKPPGYFPNHVVVQIGDTLYDPSYGKTYASVKEFQQQAVAGFYLGGQVTRKSGGKDVQVFALFMRKKTDTVQVDVLPIAEYVTKILTPPPKEE